MKRSGFTPKSYDDTIASLQAKKPRSSTWLSAVIRNYLGDYCLYCDSTESLHIHHVLPVAHGGKDEMGNLEVVCKPCHIKLHKELDKVYNNKRRSAFRECKICGGIKDFIKKEGQERIYLCEGCNAISHEIE